MKWMIKRESKSVIVGNNDEKKLFCTCGFAGIVNDLVCPDCAGIPEINLLNQVRLFLTYLTESESEKFINLKFEICSYRFIEQKLDFKFSKKVYIVSMHKENGACFVERAGHTTGLTGRPIDYYSCDFWSDTKPFIDIRREILKRFSDYRKIEYFNIEEYLDEQFYKAFVFIQYPNLLLLERLDLIAPEYGFSEEINSATDKYDLIQKLTNHKSNKILNLIQDPRAFNFLLIWGKYIKQPENVLNFIEHFDLKAFPNSVFEIDIPYSTFYDGINVIKNLHQNADEKIWLHRLAKYLKKNQSDENGNVYFRYYNQTEIEDIGNMHQQILDFKPDYVPLFDGDITNLHDTLALDLQKIQKQNFPIKYSEKELFLEKEIDENKKIVLAPDTHSLVDVGSQMSICVGSYDKRAVKKECTIAILKENESPVVCIELKKNKLIQAKMKYNKRPTGIYKDAVISWCEEKGVNYKTCYDIA
jgi:hypothetical protein